MQKTESLPYTFVLMRELSIIMEIIGNNETIISNDFYFGNYDVKGCSVKLNNGR